jgi:hypothetical protein
MNNVEKILLGIIGVETITGAYLAHKCFKTTKDLEETVAYKNGFLERLAQINAENRFRDIVDRDITDEEKIEILEEERLNAQKTYLGID